MKREKEYARFVSEGLSHATMFEARLTQASLLKKIIDALKDLVTDANWDVNENGISLQAMDSSHVSLVALLLRADGFEKLCADRNLTLGINISSMAKIMKCAANDDILTMRADDAADSITFVFEGAKSEKISDFELKLMDIDGEFLGIPETEYNASITMSSAEFAKICRDLTILGDTVVISATKEGVKFSVDGDLGSGNILVKQDGGSADDKSVGTSIELTEPVTLTFALRYLNFFTKATALSDRVKLSISPDVPLVVEYNIEELGYIRFYLAPKIEDADAN
jgi:proliferating cell nuclear antigen